MIKRMTLIFLCFYLITACFLIPFLSGMGQHFMVNKHQMITYPSDQGPIQEVHTLGTWILLKTYVVDYYYQTKHEVLSLDRFTVTRNLFAVILALMASFFLSRSINGQYRRLCEGIEAISSGDYSARLLKKGYFPELSDRVGHLSTRLQQEKLHSEALRDEEAGLVNETLAQLKATLAGIKGKSEVLIETGALEQSSEESRILESIYSDMSSMEAAIHELIHKRQS